MVLEQELSQATNRLSQKLIIKIYYYLIEKLFLNAVATTILLYPASLFFDLAYSVFLMFSVYCLSFSFVPKSFVFLTVQRDLYYDLFFEIQSNKFNFII